MNRVLTLVRRIILNQRDELSEQIVRKYKYILCKKNALKINMAMIV